MEDGVIITLKNLKEWEQYRTINGTPTSTRSVFAGIQSRLWECPDCGVKSRIEHSLDATIIVGNPICECGEEMELVNTVPEHGPQSRKPKR